MGNLPEISGFYNFYEVFAHFKGCFANKNLTYYFMCLRYPIQMVDTSQLYWFYLIYHCQESIGKPITPPPPCRKFLCTNKSQTVHSIRAMVIALASHFRRGFSVGEIHCLRRLNREGSPERFSRSQQLVRWSVAPASEQSPLSECVRLEQLSTH